LDLIGQRFIRASFYIPHVTFRVGNIVFDQGGTGWLSNHPGLMNNQLSGAFCIFLSRRFFLNFPRAIDDAGYFDGCSPWLIYLQTRVPNAKPFMATLGILKVTAAWNDSALVP